MFKPNILTFPGKESCFLVAFSLHFKTLDSPLLTRYSELVMYGNPILINSVEIFRTLFLSQLWLATQ